MIPQSEIRDPQSAKAGLTLLEVLAVVAIVAILAGLLLPAVFAARRHARKVQAQTEAQTMEAAWRKYYSEYQKWPSNTVEGTAYPMVGDRAAILLGSAVGSDNPRQLTFLQFRRFAPDGNLVNPWWNPNISSMNCLYFVKFDADHDNRIAGGTGDEPQADVTRQVIVWTCNPDAAPGDSSSIIRSWQP